MEPQLTHKLIMIEPVAFCYNPETAQNNFFQQYGELKDVSVQEKALSEFQEMVHILRTNDVLVTVYRDSPEPHTPDSIFPNNLISFHPGGRTALYPQYAVSRRAERLNDWIRLPDLAGVRIRQCIDYSHYEEQAMFLEGTGSMVLDRQNRIAFASVSERTNPTLLEKFCSDFDYRPLFFHGFHNVGNERKPVYHTNVMMSVGENLAIVCCECIDDPEERARVCAILSGFGKTVIPITEYQMQHFAGNMLQVKNKKGNRLLLMSGTAYSSLTDDQIDKLSELSELIVIPVPTIEKYGGGSVRCMCLEIFD